MGEAEFCSKCSLSLSLKSLSSFYSLWSSSHFILFDHKPKVDTCPSRSQVTHTSPQHFLRAVTEAPVAARLFADGGQSWGLSEIDPPSLQPCIPSFPPPVSTFSLPMVLIISFASPSFPSTFCIPRFHQLSRVSVLTSPSHCGSALFQWTQTMQIKAIPQVATLELKEKFQKCILQQIKLRNGAER